MFFFKVFFPYWSHVLIFFLVVGLRRWSGERWRKLSKTASIIFKVDPMFLVSHVYFESISNFDSGETFKRPSLTAFHRDLRQFPALSFAGQDELYLVVGLSPIASYDVVWMVWVEIRQFIAMNKYQIPQRVRNLGSLERFLSAWGNRFQVIEALKRGVRGKGDVLGRKERGLNQMAQWTWEILASRAFSIPKLIKVKAFKIS